MLRRPLRPNYTRFVVTVFYLQHGKKLEKYIMAQDPNKLFFLVFSSLLCFLHACFIGLLFFFTFELSVHKNMQKCF